MDYVYILREALIWIITIFWLYQILVSVCSLVKLKDKPLKVNKNHRFMAIIPAHNEEAVVGNLIESLKNQEYDKNLYDIYVIADNCTDRTARIAREAGAIVYERYDETKKTKGYALDWFLQQKMKEDAPYDAICIFDADNIVDKNFLKAMNKKLCQGEEVVQGYRDIKNPTDNWITSGYALFYWTMHKFYHLARYNLGLSPLLNGTGFMVSFDIIKENGGWKTVTLTEDIEFSLQRILKGKRLGWSTEAIVYDEQPTGFAQSWSQRSRWTVGHMQCMKEYTSKLAQAVKDNKTMMYTDLAVEIQEECSGRQGEIPGVLLEQYKGKGIRVTKIQIQTADGAKRMGRPIGNYMTLESADKEHSDEHSDKNLSGIKGAI